MDIKKGVIQPIGEVSMLTMEELQVVLPVGEITLQSVPIIGDIQDGDDKTQSSTSATGRRRSGTVHGGSGSEGGRAVEKSAINDLHADHEAGEFRGGDKRERTPREYFGNRV